MQGQRQQLQQQLQPLQPANEAPQQHGMLVDDQHVLQAAHQPEQHDGQAAQQAGQQVPAWQSYNSVFTAAKAGMGGVDQQKVKQVVYEMSKVTAEQLLHSGMSGGAGRRGCVEQ
jgi:hypothetical protein